MCHGLYILYIQYLKKMKPLPVLLSLLALGAVSGCDTGGGEGTSITDVTGGDLAGTFTREERRNSDGEVTRQALAYPYRLRLDTQEADAPPGREGEEGWLSARVFVPFGAIDDYGLLDTNDNGEPWDYSCEPDDFDCVNEPADHYRLSMKYRPNNPDASPQEQARGTIEVYATPLPLTGDARKYSGLFGYGMLEEGGLPDVGEGYDEDDRPLVNHACDPAIEETGWVDDVVTLMEACEDDGFVCHRFSADNGDEPFADYLVPITRLSNLIGECGTDADGSGD